MLFYVCFAFWELLFRSILTILLKFLWIGRLLFLLSIPVFVLILCTIVVAKIAFRLTLVPSDENRSVRQIVTSRGFLFQEHSVRTEDGYILTLFRIGNPHIDEQTRARKPVLLMHGIGTHGLFFLLNDERGPVFKRLIDPNDPLFKYGEKTSATESEDQEQDDGAEDALAFDLAARGYDVWLGNQRGSRFSCRHAILHPVKDAAKFWNFSFDEMAQFDLPAIIRFIMKETGSPRLGYVGHSQGATVMLALMSNRPEYNDMIRPFIAMAPPVRMRHSQVITGFGNTVRKWLPTFALWFPGRVYPSFCEFVVQLFFCNHSLESFSNLIGRSLYFGKHVNQKRVSAFLAFPGIHCSRKNIAHYFQLRDNEFSHFDYGTKGNQKRYGTPSPLPYKLDRVSCSSICLIYSTDDSLVAAADVRHLIRRLGVQPLDEFVIRDKNWDHSDFQLGKGCGIVVNERIVLLLRVAMDWDSSHSRGSASAPSTGSSHYSSPDPGPSSLTSEQAEYLTVPSFCQDQDFQQMDDLFHSLTKQGDEIMGLDVTPSTRSSASPTSSSGDSSSFEIVNPGAAPIATQRLSSSSAEVRRRRR